MKTNTLSDPRHPNVRKRERNRGKSKVTSDNHTWMKDELNEVMKDEQVSLKEDETKGETEKRKEGKGRRDRKKNVQSFVHTHSHSRCPIIHPHPHPAPHRTAHLIFRTPHRPNPPLSPAPSTTTHVRLDRPEKIPSGSVTKAFSYK